MINLEYREVQLIKADIFLCSMTLFTSLLGRLNLPFYNAPKTSFHLHLQSYFSFFCWKKIFFTLLEPEWVRISFIAKCMQQNETSLCSWFVRAHDLRESCLIEKCRCYDAERRLMSGEISCEGGTLVNNCPDGCEVCVFCLAYVLGDYCDGVTSEPSPGPSIIPTSISPPSDTPDFDLSVCDTYENEW